MATRQLATVVLAVLSGLQLAACSTEEDPGSDAGADAGGGVNPLAESPRVCDGEECPVVENAAGTRTRTLHLKARGGVRQFLFEGEPVDLHVSTYNGTLPGPTVEIEATASDPENPRDSDLLIIDLTNEGALNTCCWQVCPPDPDPPVLLGALLPRPRLAQRWRLPAGRHRDQPPHARPPHGAGDGGARRGRRLHVRL